MPEGSSLIASTAIIGVGISEADYDADVYQTSTTASIVSNGTTLSTNTATGTFSAVAETQYTLETNFGTVSPEEPEAQYDIQSTHTYSDNFGYFFYRYTYAIIWISFRYTGYLYAGMGYGGCSGQSPFGYSASCPLWDGCQKAKLCSRYVSAAIQGYGYRFRTIGFQWCQVWNFHVPFRPHCRQ